MVKPGGTGRPRLAISARLAPLPPSKSRISALPSALPSPNVNTHLPDFAPVAGFSATTLPTGFGVGSAMLFFSALRAEAAGVAFDRTGIEDFDFAAVFFVFATALAMTANNPREEGKLRALHHFGGFRASREPRFKALEVKPFQQPETNQASANQIDRDHQVEQPRHDQNENASDQRHNGWNVGSRDGHEISPEWA